MREIREAIRLLSRQRAFSAAAIAMLAIGIGSATAVYSLVHGVLVRSLPFRQPDRLVWMYNLRTERDRAPLSIPDLQDYQRDAQTLAGVAVFTNWTANLTGVGEAERLEGTRVSGNFFELVGTAAAAGRALQPADEAGNSRHVVLTDGLWKRHFGGDLSIVGRTIDLNGAGYLVVGVLPPGFVFPFRQAELAVPLAIRDDPRRSDRGANFLRAVARLQPGVTIAQAKADLDTIARRLQRQYPVDDARKIGISLYPLHAEMVRDYRQVLWTLFAAVGVLVAIGCGNLANLLLARASRRQGELAVRAALGASRGRLARLLMLEAATLAIPGGAAGVLFASGAISAWRAFAPVDFPRVADLAVDGPVVLFACGLSLAVALFCGLLPAWIVSRDVAHAIAGGARTVTPGIHQGLIRRAFVVVQVAGSAALMIYMGLASRSLGKLETVDPGFTADQTLSLQLSLPSARYGSPPAFAQFHDSLKARFTALPDVSVSGAVSLMPLSGLLSTIDIAFPDRPVPPPDEVPQAHFRIAGPGYFEAAGIQVIAGRSFTEDDSANGRPVAIVSRTLADRHWPGQNAVGEYLQLVPALPSAMEVVGVVADVQQFGIDQGSTADLYLPLHQMPPSQATLVAARMYWVIRARMAGALQPDLVRRAVHDVDPDVATSSIRTLDEVRESALSSRRVNVRALEIFSQVALALAAFGVYAVTAFSAGTRQRELAIRLAFGANRRELERLLVGGELVPVLMGLAIGMAAAFAAGPTMAGTLFATSPRDPLVFVVVSVALGVLAALAGYVAAARAVRLNPIDLLRA